MEGEYPNDFKCPISLEIMTDPVILSSGHTFDRSSIQRWLDSGHRTCPITKLPLPDHPVLIPNHALRSLISSFTPLSTSSYSLPTPPQTLISTLLSPSSPLNSKLHSLSLLAKLTKLDPSLRRLLSESGAASSVLNCLNSPKLQEKALSLLLNLSLDDDNKVGLVAEGAIAPIVNIIRLGSDSDSPAIACTVLTSLAVVEVNKATIGSYPGAIASLVSLLDFGKGREVKEAATALLAICSFPDNRRRVVESGAVKILVRVGGMGLERAVEVLSVLVKCKEGREEMGRVKGCVGVLGNVLRNGGERGVQCALFTLNCLCCWNERMCAEARKEGVLEVCTRLVEDENENKNGNEKIWRNATELVETLCGRSRTREGSV